MLQVEIGRPDPLIPGKSLGQPSKIPPELTADIRAALQQTSLPGGYGEASTGTRAFSKLLARSVPDRSS